MTNREKLDELRRRIGEAESRIRRLGLEQEYLKLLEREGDKESSWKAISEEEWEVMLPAEQDRNVLHYYHTLRVEHYALLKTAKGFAGSIKSFLDDPWVRLGLTGATLGKLAVDVASAILQSGFFYQDEREEDDLVDRFSP